MNNKSHSYCSGNFKSLGSSVAGTRNVDKGIMYFLLYERDNDKEFVATFSPP